MINELLIIRTTLKSFYNFDKNYENKFNVYCYNNEMSSNEKKSLEDKSDEEIEEILNNIYIDVYTSDKLFQDILEKIKKELYFIDEYDVEYTVEEKKEKSFLQLEPYRTKISNINFVLINILKKLTDEPDYILTTRTLYETVATNVSTDVESYLTKYKLLNEVKLDKLELKLKLRKKKLKEASNIESKIIEQEIDSIKNKIYVLKNPKKLKDQVLINEVQYDVEGSKPEDTKTRDIIQKALKYLSSYNLIKRIDGKDAYKLNIDQWFGYTKYAIRNKSILNNFLPLLISFLKYNAPNRIDDFLKHFGEIVWALSSPPEDMAEYANVENYILRALNITNTTISFRVLDKDTSDDIDSKVDFINVQPIQIIIIESSIKVLKFFDADEDKEYEIQINKIFRLTVPLNTENSIFIASTKESYIYNDGLSEYIKSKEYLESREEYYLNEHFNHGIKTSVILESDTNMLDFYENSFFKNIKTFTTQEDKNLLFKEYIDEYLIEVDNVNRMKIKNHLEKNLYSGSKIYAIIENEKVNDILSLVLKGESVNIIYPLSLQKKYLNTINEKNNSALDFSKDA